MQFIITAVLVAFSLSTIILVKLCVSKSSHKIASVWGCAVLVLLILIVAYFSPTSFKWNAPASETTVRILGEAPAINIDNPTQKENLISALCSISFQRPFYNSNSKSYDPNIETRFLICVQAGKESKEITVSVATSDHHIYFIETDSGLQAKDPNQLLGVFNSILL